MNQEKQPHWILVAFGTAVITAFVNSGMALLSLLWMGMTRLSWFTIGILAVSVLIESMLLFSVFVLGIRYTLLSFGSLLLALISKEQKTPKWTDPFECMVWKVASLLVTALRKQS